MSTMRSAAMASPAEGQSLTSGPHVQLGGPLERRALGLAIHSPLQSEDADVPPSPVCGTGPHVAEIYAVHTPGSLLVQHSKPALVSIDCAVLPQLDLLF